MGFSCIHACMKGREFKTLVMLLRNAIQGVDLESIDSPLELVYMKLKRSSTEERLIDIFEMVLSEVEHACMLF